MIKDIVRYFIDKYLFNDTFIKYKLLKIMLMIVYSIYRELKEEVKLKYFDNIESIK